MSAQQSDDSFIRLYWDELSSGLLEEEYKCDEDEEFSNKEYGYINDPPAPGSLGGGSSSHALSRDSATLSALSGLHPVQAMQGPPSWHQPLLPRTSTPPEASTEHLTSDFGVTSSAVEKIWACHSSGSAGTISDWTEHFGSLFGGLGASTELGPMFGGGQHGISAEMEELGTELARMCEMEGCTCADSGSTIPADSDMSDFSSGSKAFGDSNPGLHVPDTYSPARFSPLTASSRNPCPSQTQVARTKQARQRDTSPGFERGSWLGRSARHPLERVSYPRGPFCKPQAPPSTPQAESSSIGNQPQPHQAPVVRDESMWTWWGELPRYIYNNPVFSTKVFLCGIADSVTEANLLDAFHAFGIVSVEWPVKRSRHTWSNMKGHAYLLFKSESGVEALLRACRCSADNDCGTLFIYKLTMESEDDVCSKEVKVIPWIVADTSIGLYPWDRGDPGLNVFVGKLHGLITAWGLASVLNTIFGGVVYVRIHVDKHRYPIGAASVVFGNRMSYMKAVVSEFVVIRTRRFYRKIQIDPFLEKSSLCQSCFLRHGSVFCRDMVCFKYFCKFCWDVQHGTENRCLHRPVMLFHKERHL